MEEGQVEEAEEAEEVLSCPRQRIQMEDGEEARSARRRPRPPRGGRKPPSHWPGRRCPSRASLPPIGREQRGEAVTEGRGDHGEERDEDDEGVSSEEERAAEEDSSRTEPPTENVQFTRERTQILSEKPV